MQTLTKEQQSLYNALVENLTITIENQRTAQQHIQTFLAAVTPEGTRWDPKAGVFVDNPVPEVPAEPVASKAD